MSALAAKTIAVNPAARFSEVIKLGICLIVIRSCVQKESKITSLFSLLLLDLYQLK
jgi:hypothetical protein